MADAKKLERSYTIPLRREFLKVPKYKRANKAIKTLKECNCCNQTILI